jgi:hypothetical protein
VVNRNDGLSIDPAAIASELRFGLSGNYRGSAYI